MPSYAHNVDSIITITLTLHLIMRNFGSNMTVPVFLYFLILIRKNLLNIVTDKEYEFQTNIFTIKSVFQELDIS